MGIIGYSLRPRKSLQIGRLANLSNDLSYLTSWKEGVTSWRFLSLMFVPDMDIHEETLRDTSANLLLKI